MNDINNHNILQSVINKNNNIILSCANNMPTLKILNDILLRNCDRIIYNNNSISWPFISLNVCFFLF